MICLYLDTYTLSSALPDSFLVSEVDTEYVEVTIQLQGQDIYTTRLYPNNEVCTFYELRQIVEQNMLKRHLKLASFKVIVDDGLGYMYYEGKFIIFSKYKNADYVDLYFLLNGHFTLDEVSAEATMLFGELFSEKLFRAQLSYFDDIDYAEAVDFLIDNPPTVDAIKSKLTMIAIGNV